MDSIYRIEIQTKINKIYIKNKSSGINFLLTPSFINLLGSKVCNTRFVRGETPENIETVKLHDILLVDIDNNLYRLSNIRYSNTSIIFNYIKSIVIQLVDDIKLLPSADNLILYTVNLEEISTIGITQV